MPCRRYIPSLTKQTVIGRINYIEMHAEQMAGQGDERFVRKMIKAILELLAYAVQYKNTLAVAKSVLVASYAMIEANEHFYESL